MLKLSSWIRFPTVEFLVAVVGVAIISLMVYLFWNRVENGGTRIGIGEQRPWRL